MTKVLNVNQSKVKTFRRCEKQYSFRYDYAGFYPELASSPRREMIPQRKRLPLYRGSWMHALQEALHHQWAGFKTFPITVGEGTTKIHIEEAHTWKDVQREMTRVFNTLFEEERADLGDLPGETERLFRSYMRFWKDDYDRYSVAELPNGKPAIEFIVEADLEKFGITDARFKGRIDLLVEDDEYDGLWIWDAKWVKNIPHSDERVMSPQAPLYVWAVREMYGLDVRGFVYNYARTKPPTIPKVLKRPAGMLSMASKMDTDQYTYLQAIKDNHGKEWKRYIPYYKEKLLELRGRDGMWFDRQRIPVETEKQLRALREYVTTVKNIQRREKRRDYIERSYFFNCKFGCDYHDLCVAEFQGLEIEPLIKNGFMFESERYGKEEELLNA